MNTKQTQMAEIYSFRRALSRTIFHRAMPYAIDYGLSALSGVMSSFHRAMLYVSDLWAFSPKNERNYRGSQEKGCKPYINSVGHRPTKNSIIKNNY